MCLSEKKSALVFDGAGRHTVKRLARIPEKHRSIGLRNMARQSLLLALCEIPANTYGDAQIQLPRAA